jgi:membrane-associated protease RseP (regulator of RpoE activity)
VERWKIQRFFRVPPSSPTVWPSGTTPAPRISLNILLFLATVLTTMIAGALHQGADPFTSLGGLFQGIPFSVSLLGILLAHEMGHYLTSRHYHVSASLPYFIPVPTFIGTMGAIIRMRSVVRDRRILFDIGVAGPLAGMVVAIPVTVVGLLLSRVIEIASGQGGITLGDSLLFVWISDWIFGPLPDTQTVLLHPVAFAGWLGFFVTSLNLIPIGQLDGGHVAYGVLGPGHRRLSRLIFLGLLFWGVHGAFFVLDPFQWLWALAFCWAGVRTATALQQGRVLRYFMVFLLVLGIAEEFVPDTLVWIFWATLMCFLRLDHPPTRDVHIPLDRKRKLIGWLALALFLLTFIPQPFQVVP